MAGASYWNCPICLRRVPERVSECYCGRKRQPEDGPDAPEEAASRGPLLATTLFVVFAGVTAWILMRPEPPGVPAPAPSVAEEPVANARALSPEIAPRPTPPAAWGEARTSPTPAAPAETRPPAPPKPTPTPADSVDAQRERGAAAFEAAIKNISGRIGALRRLVQTYDDQCPGGLAIVKGCDAPREQIEQSLREIQAALDEAEEAARRSWVDPGVQRAIRDRSGMDDVTVGETLAAATAATRR